MYSLSIFDKLGEDKIRIYINGTTRSKVYFMRGRDGRVVWSSKVADTPQKFQSGNHYQKKNKDGDAARAVAEAFGVSLGDGTGDKEWDILMEAAKNGVSVEPQE